MKIVLVIERYGNLMINHKMGYQIKINLDIKIKNLLGLS